MNQLQEVAVQPTEAAEAARTDFNFLSMLTMPGEFLFPFPSFYLVLFTLLTAFKQRVERFAIGIPRGFAKTTFVKVLCVWYVLFSHKHFILIVSASEKKAVAILADICDMLSSPNIRRLFGNWDANIEKDDATTKVFHFRGREIILWAAGAGTSVRGINRKNKRPDVMIMDDIQDREEAKNKELAEGLITWMLSTLMKARSPFGCTYIFIGNMYPQNCILERLKNNKQWTSFVVGGITADGESLWEELKPIDELLEEYQSDTEMLHPEVFITEVLNSTDIALASGIDPALISFCPSYILEVEQGEGSYIVIDPSSGKKQGDDCTIEHFEVIDGHDVFDELLSGTFSPLDTIKHAIEMGLRRNTRLICVEDVAYQSTLLFWFEHWCEQQGITGFHFMPISPKNQAKNNRIKKGFTLLCPDKDKHTQIYLHPNIRSLAIAQYTAWEPLKINNKDDLIDGIGYAEEIRREYPELIVRNIFDTSNSSQSRAAFTEDLALPF